MQVLDLHDNGFTTAGSRSLAEALKCLPKLRVINFGQCHMWPEGGLAIARALEHGHLQLEVRTVNSL